VASLFPRNPNLAEAMRLDGPRRCVALPVGPDGLPPLQPRISLTLAAISTARRIIVYVSGASKLTTLERALAGDDLLEMPVRALLAGPAPMRVIWSAR
jgi:6-phosphogluconolactonase